MPDAALTRLRVAQAARLPVTPEQVAAQLRADDAAQSLSVEDVTGALEDWAHSGLLEELPGGRYVQRAIFRTDLQRRVCANLAEPRTEESLRTALRSDPSVGLLAGEDLSGLLAELAADGLVENVGEHEDADSLLSLIDADPETIDLHPDKADALSERLGRPERAWRLDGEQFLMTRRAHEALQVT